MKILILDDEKELCDVLVDFINMLGGHNVIALYDSRQALEIILQQQIQLLITDVRMPYLTGLELVDEINRRQLPVSVILISGQEDVIHSINALDLGIFDFITKPVDVEKIARLIEQVRVAAPLPESAGLAELTTRQTVLWEDLELLSGAVISNELVGEIALISPAMRNILKKIRKIAQLPEIPVLIEGKTGTGKELIARLIHSESPQREKPFVALNCAAIDKNLFESELFGYVKGAFTGADVRGKIGKIQLADGGSLFLDEITEITPELQSKLLRLLQEKEYYSVGGNEKLIMKARIICATNRNIKKMIQQGEFREDLFYRLDVCKITVPALKARSEEIIPLSLLMGKDLCRKNSLTVCGISGEALAYLSRFPWPGNVRQLKNALTKAILFCDEKFLSLQDFAFLDGGAQEKPALLDPALFQLPNEGFVLDDFVSEIIFMALIRFEGNKTRTAEFLGLDRYQFYRRYRQVVEQYEAHLKRDKSPG